MKRDWAGIAILALLCMLPGCREKPKSSPRLESMVTPGIALTTRTDYADPYVPTITINWTVILSGIPTGCVIAGNAEGVPSGYVMRKSPHLEETMGPPDYWCNPKWKNKP